MSDRKSGNTTTSAYLKGFVTALLALLCLLSLSTSLQVISAADTTFSCASVTEIPQTECEALVALYDSTDGDNWTDNSGWLVTNEPCGWHGVMCNEGSVSRLALNENNLVGILSPELSNLNKLEELRLYRNKLSGSIPPELGSLSELTEFSISDNQLSGSIPSELGMLTNLRILNLHGNDLSGSIPAELGNLENLVYLMLVFNELSGPIPPELGNLTSLASLYLSFNELSGTIPAELGNLNNLTHLDLSFNQLSGSIPPELGSLDRLWILYLGRNQLSGDIPAELGGLSNLGALSLSNNYLSGYIPAELSDLSNLRGLYLQNNQIDGEIPAGLGNLDKLETLYLHNNRLSGDIPAELGNLNNLIRLDLTSNRLGGSIPSELSNLSNLREFDFGLGYNLLTASDPTLLAFLQSKEPTWADTQTVPPTDVQAGAVTESSIEITWTPILYTADGGYYEVLTSATAGGPYDQPGCVTADKMAAGCTVDGLEPDTTYYFVVQTFTPAHNSQQNDLWSDFSAELTVTTAELSLLLPDIYNSHTGAVNYAGDWTDTTDSSAYDGQAKAASQAGATLTFHVDGDAVDTLVIHRTMDPSFGRMRVVVHGSPDGVQSESTYIDRVFSHNDLAARQYTQPAVVLGIGPGPQTVTVTNLDAGQTTQIEAVELIGALPPLGPALYNSHDPGIRYVGNWGHRDNPGAMSGNFWLHLERAGSALLEIDGDSVVIYHTMNADRDYFEVCFNGDYANCTRVSAQVGARWFSNRQVIATPSYGRHLVEIRSANDSAFSIEAVEVLGVQQPLLPGYYEEDNSQMRYQGYWRPRLSFASMGNNIQVAEEGGSATFLVDAAQFGGFGFYYRGGPEYGPVRVCREGGEPDGCVIFDQQRPSREDGLLRSITPMELDMPATGVHTLRIDRPSGDAHINIEAMVIVGALGVGTVDAQDQNLMFSDGWARVLDGNAYDGQAKATSQAGATLDFGVNGDAVETLVIHRTMDPSFGRMRVEVSGTPPGGGAETTYISREFSHSDLAARQYTQPAVVLGIGPGPQTVTVTNLDAGKITQIEAVELVGAPPVMAPGLYNSHDSSIRYIGNWGHRDNGEAMFGNFWLHLERAGSAMFEIEGDGIVVYHTMNADRDYFEVCFNGDYANCTRVSAQVGARWFSNRQVIAAPSYGRHLVEIRSANDSAFSLEAVEVLGVQRLLLPGYYEENNSQMRYQGYWRPRLSLASMGSNIQVAEQGGSATFLVDAANFGGFGFYYRGGPEYGPVHVCRVGGEPDGCVNFDQQRPSRQDGLLHTITRTELKMPMSGIYAIRIDRPTGSAHINIEGIHIIGLLGPGTVDSYHPDLIYSGNWIDTSNPAAYTGKMRYTSQSGAALTFHVGGDQIDMLAIHRTMNPLHGRMRVAVMGVPPSGGVATTYISREFSQNDLQARQFTQPAVITGIGPGPQTVTITNLDAGKITQIEAVELIGALPVMAPGLYNSHDSSIRYIGNWGHRDNPGAMFGNFWLHLQRAGSALLEIDGDGVVIYHTMNADRDYFEVCFNGDYANCTRVSAQVGARWFSNRQVIAAPSYGRHLVEIRSANDNAFSLEAIEVLGHQQALLPGYYEEDNSQMRYQGYWRPRLSLASMGSNIQVAEEGGSATFLVDAAQFGGFGFYYRGGPEYGPVRVCRVGGEPDGCVVFDQQRPSREDGLLRSIIPRELGMPTTGIHTIRIDRPSGDAHINIEAMEIMPVGWQAVAPVEMIPTLTPTLLEPTVTATLTATLIPTETPTELTTETVTVVPTEIPTEVVLTDIPTDAPTDEVTAEPTATEEPTLTLVPPTEEPTATLVPPTATTVPSTEEPTAPLVPPTEAPTVTPVPPTAMPLPTETPVGGEVMATVVDD